METTKDSIDWSHVHERYKWMARDSDGDAIIFENKPCIPTRYSRFWSPDGKFVFADDYASYKQGTCDWRESLVERPKALEE